MDEEETKEELPLPKTGDELLRRMEIRDKFYDEYGRFPTDAELWKILTGEKFTLKDRVKILEEKLEQIHRDTDYIKKRKVRPKIIKFNEKIKKFKVKKYDKEIIEKERGIKIRRKKKEIKIPEELIQKGKFISKDIQKIFNMNPMTASRYIKRWILEKKVKRIGKPRSTNVFYEIISYSK